MADQFLVCWHLNFKWTSLYVLTRLTTRILNSDLRKIRLAPEFPELLGIKSGSACIFLFKYNNI